MSQTDDFMLLGIHSTKYDEFLFGTFNICSSTSLVDILPRNMHWAVSYLPCLGSAAHIMFLASNACTERVALYGSTTVSDTLGEGMMEKVSMIRSGYSSRILEMSSVPMPEPVPPPPC